MNRPVRVAVTGAAGQIGYQLCFRIAAGDMLGPDQPVILQMLEITPALDALRGVTMSLEDCVTVMERSPVWSQPYGLHFFERMPDEAKASFLKRMDVEMRVTFLKKSPVWSQPYGLDYFEKSPVSEQPELLSFFQRMTVDDKISFACVDGPFFDAHEVDFDEAVSRGKMYVKEEQKAAECQRAAHQEEAA